MLQGLGRVIWSHTRDITVMNFPKAIVYEIYNSDGYLYVKYDKTTKDTTVSPQRPDLYHPLHEVKRQETQPSQHIQ